MLTANLLVRAFDGDVDAHFWFRVGHIHVHRSGPSFLSGWLTAFCAWSKGGEWIGPRLTVSHTTNSIPRISHQHSVKLMFRWTIMARSSIV
ncbi:hypothetical protein BJ165DRAFT_1507581 [Panaeolus papilionaceus]|nr:hypothetical protein BJ165DRAFT_1507581 [Panaeolus papilionaceus]